MKSKLLTTPIMVKRHSLDISLFEQDERAKMAREILRSMTLEEKKAFLKEEFSPSDIEKQHNTRDDIPMDNLKFWKRLGKGASGVTYHGNWQTKNDDSLEVAIKVAAISEHGENGWGTEKELLQSFQVPHPNVIQLHGYASLKAAEKKGSKETRCLVLEYCNAGDLSTVMHLHSPPDFIMHISQSIAKGMAFLHKSSIIHRDLKPENVLLHGDRTSPRKLNVKIADLGLGKRITQRHEEHTAETGTYRYMAPEVIRHQPYSFQADVYSFGILFWQLITRETPFSDDISQIEAAGRVALHKIRPPFPEGAPKCVVDLINLCWNENPNKRPTFDEIVITLDQFECERKGMAR